MFPGRRQGGISARGQRLNAVFCRSRSGDDGAAVGQAAALLLVDVEVIEQAAAEQCNSSSGVVEEWLASLIVPPARLS